MNSTAGGPTRSVPWTSLSGLIIAVLLASYLVISAGGANAAVGDCTVARSGTSNVITWEASGQTDVIRRNGSWLTTPPAGTTTYTDDGAPADASYLIRTRIGGTATDFPCSANEDGAPDDGAAGVEPPVDVPAPDPVEPAAPTPVVAGECFVSRADDANVLIWGDGGGRHVLRVDGRWLTTPGADVATYTHVGGPEGASYELRTYHDNGRVDTTCTTAPTPPVDAPAVDPIDPVIDTEPIDPEPVTPDPVDPEPVTPEPVDPDPVIDPEPAAPVLPVGGECFISRTDNANVLMWGDAGGRHVLRVDGRWLTTPGFAVSSYIDVGGAEGASYELRTYQANGRVDTICTDAPATPVIPVVDMDPDRQFVVQVSMDGLRSDFVNAVITPNLAELIADGASTLNARTDPENTQTLPNHASQFTGRYATGDENGEGGTGVLFNVDAGNTIHDTAGEYVSSIWDVVHDNGGRTVLYNGKTKFEFYNRSWNSAGAPDETGADDGPVKIDVFRRGDPSTSVGSFINDLTAGTGDTFGLYHIREPDSAGHVHSWGSPGYVDGVAAADVTLGQLLDGLDAAGVRDMTTIIITADHGGPSGGLLHNTPTDQDAFTVPFIVQGPGVAVGADLYSLNADTRQDPGLIQIGPTGPQPIRGHDMANLALDILGLPPIPGSVVNSEQDLAIN